MKKLGFCFMLFIVGAFCFAQSNFQLLTSSLYSIRSYERQDIRGDLVEERLLIFKETDWGTQTNRFISLSKLTRGSETVYSFIVQVFGSKWLFVDTLMIKVDQGNVVSLKNDSPSREVQRNASVEEFVVFVLEEQLERRIKNCNTLTLQFYQSPISIPPEGIEAIKRFMDL